MTTRWARTSQCTLARSTALIAALACALLAACSSAAPSPAATQPAATQPPVVASTTGAGAAPVASVAASAGPSAAASAAPASASPAAIAPAGPAGALQTVSYGELKLLSDAGVYIAMEEGYFAEQGIQINLTTFDSAGNMVSPLATNQLDIGGGALSAGLYNAINRGIDVRIVADKGHNDPTPPGFPVSTFMVRKDLIDSGQVKSVSDLKGLKYAQAAPGISPELDYAALFKLGGFTPADVSVTYLGFPDLASAFASKSIDFANPVEPFATFIKNQGLGVEIKEDYEVHPNYQTAVVLFSPQFDASPLADKFMIAYLKGIRLYLDGFIKKDQQAHDAVVKDLIAHTPVTDPALYDEMAPQGLSGDGTMYLNSFDEQQDYFVAAGEQDTRVDLSKVVNLQHIQAAVQALGEYH